VVIDSSPGGNILIEEQLRSRLPGKRERRSINATLAARVRADDPIP
jgi:hypothetical protein